MATKVERLFDRLRAWRRPRDLGQRGEALAARELSRQGYEIVARRWRCRLGEIDIVARDGPSLVIVEVKTRTRKDYGRAVDAVDFRKQRKLIQLARAYQRTHADSSRFVRFDVIGVDASSPHKPRIELIRHAFEA